MECTHVDEAIFRDQIRNDTTTTTMTTPGRVQCSRAAIARINYLTVVSVSSVLRFVRACALCFVQNVGAVCLRANHHYSAGRTQRGFTVSPNTRERKKVYLYSV